MPMCWTTASLSTDNHLHKILVLGHDDGIRLPGGSEDVLVLGMAEPNITHGLSFFAKFRSDPFCQGRRQVGVHPNHTGTKTGWLSLRLAY